jgi:hypothetical protein
VELLNAGRIHHRISIVFPTYLSDKHKARKINVSDIQRNLCTALWGTSENFIISAVGHHVIFVLLWGTHHGILVSIVGQFYSGL